MWKIANRQDVLELVSSARLSLHVCSPYITWDGIRLLKEGLASRRLQALEVWTKFNMRDWVTGASDPDALRDFVKGLPRRTDVRLYTSGRLHAKFLIADSERAIAGSANLTSGGLGGNIEIVRVLPAPEMPELLSYIHDTRELLQVAALQDLDQFVSRCNSQAKDREALLDLIREAVPPPLGGRKPLIPLAELIRYSSQFPGKLCQVILTIFHNLDENNRTGHLKQAFYAVQRFLQEYPHHLPYVTNLTPDRPFEVVGTPLENDWREFLSRFKGESDAAFSYDLAILVESYLNPPLGGTRRRSGGGGDYPFKIVWPFVGRLMGQ